MRGIWVVDDDQSIRWVLEKAVRRQGLACRVFENARDAIKALESEIPAVLVSDIRMPGKSGLDLLQYVRDRLPSLPVIIMTAYSDLESAVSAFQGGAFEYLPKPFDVNKAIELIQRAISEAPREATPTENPDETPEILGQAPAMQDVFRAIGRLSQSNVTVLITGESGSGKELVAKALHRHSPRASEPFIALNTAAIPKDLLESELFGHERGSFTGAAQQRRGRFEQAEGGTLFLDEIGDMPSELQTRLLRVLSDGNYYRVGGHQPIKANVRVIAATHQNLEDRVRQGLFREDLFHRLNVIRLRLPPLRERREDIPLLTRYFLSRSAQELGVDSKRLSEPVVHALSQLPFPGNVRQLENLCRWLTVMAPSQVVQLHDLPPEVLETLPPLTTANQPVRMSNGDAQPVSVEPGLSGLGGGVVAAAPLGPTSLGTAVSTALRPESERRAHGVASVDEAGARLHSTAVASTGVDEGPSGQPLSPFSTVIQRFGEVYPTPAPVSDTVSAAGSPPESRGVLQGGLPAELVFQGFQGGVGAVGALASGSPLGGASISPIPEANWLTLLDRVAEQLLEAGDPAVMDRLSAQFETTLIRAALRCTHGRRIEAAQRLGIGRNTITRKIQELQIPTEDLE